MFASITFLFVTTLLALSEQLPVEPAAALAASRPLPAAQLDHKIHPAEAKKNAASVNVENKKLTSVPKSETKLPAVVAARPAIIAVEPKPAQHSVKVRDVGASLQDDLLPSNGEEEPLAFGEGSSFEGRNRRIKVLPAFLG